MEYAAMSLAYKGSQYFIYETLQQFTTQTTNNATPKIVDTPLTLILMYSLSRICRSNNGIHNYFSFLATVRIDLARDPWERLAQ